MLNLKSSGEPSASAARTSSILDSAFSVAASASSKTPAETAPHDAQHDAPPKNHVFRGRGVEACRATRDMAEPDIDTAHRQV